MKKALQYKDEKSDKFWRIETLENESVINFGKTDTIGKYQIKEFADEEACVKDAQKQIASKVKKGYVEVDFDYNNHLYIDDEEWGLHPLTSHPNFRNHFKDDFYYDCGEEESPFGSDEGADTLFELYDLVRKKNNLDFLSQPKYLVEKVWDMKYLSGESLDRNEIEKILATDDKYDFTQSEMTTYATAFGQIKITGRVSEKLRELALTSIKRMELVAEIGGWLKPGQESEIADRMIKDLESFEILE